MKKIIIFLIKTYQKTISPDHSWLGYHLGLKVCRFYPTCSEYTSQAIIKFGIVRGLFVGLQRVLCCHPFHPGGIDEINPSLTDKE